LGSAVHVHRPGRHPSAEQVGVQLVDLVGGQLGQPDLADLGLQPGHPLPEAAHRARLTGWLDVLQPAIEVVGDGEGGVAGDRVPSSTSPTNLAGPLSAWWADPHTVRRSWRSVRRSYTRSCHTPGRFSSFVWRIGRLLRDRFSTQTGTEPAARRS
jgi:hypothetical protein